MHQASSAAKPNNLQSAMLTALKTSLADVEGIVGGSGKSAPSILADTLKVVGLSASLVTYASMFQMPDKKMLSRVWDIYKKVRLTMIQELSSNPTCRV